MKQFLVGHQDVLDIIGWHVALLLAFIAGIQFKHWLENRR